MAAVNLADAKAHLSALVARAEAGETVDIMRRGKRVARLVAAEAPREKVDVAMLEGLTRGRPRSPQPADELVRAMRESDRY